MYQNAYVSKVDHKSGLVTVGCSLGQCQGCHATLFCNTRNQSFQVRNPKGIELAEGSYVTIFLPPGKTILSSVILFATPLVLFLLFFIAVPSDNDFIKAGIGLGGGALGFLFSFLYFRKRKEALMPEIVSVSKSPIELKLRQEARILEDNDAGQD